MSFSTKPLSTILGWCDANKCSKIEITNLESGLVETLFVVNQHEIVIQINTITFISSIVISKLDTEDSKTKVFSQENVLLENCLEILESNFKHE